MDSIYTPCDNCGAGIDLTRDNFWLKHGRYLTSEERRAFGTLCEICIVNHIIKGIKNEIDAIRKRSLEINSRQR